MMLAKVSQHRPRGFRFFGPLGLTVVYGFAGIAGAFLSPDLPVSLRWAILYLSVPLILWAVVWGNDPLDQIGRIIRLNWFLIMFGVAALFVFTLIYLDLASTLSRPWTLLQCERAGSWYLSTSGYIRSTGVGRIAAVAAIISFSLLWRTKKWRVLGIVALYLSLVLLMSTGARTSIFALAAAAPLIAVLHWGKKAVIVSALALAILAPVAWNTGVLQTFLQSCILRSYDPAGITYLNIQTLEPDASFQTALQPTQEQSAAPDQRESILHAPDGGIILRRIDVEDKAYPDSPVVISLPSGEWSLKQVLSPDTAPSGGMGSPPAAYDSIFPSVPSPVQPVTQVSTPIPTIVSDSPVPVRIQIPSGEWVVETHPVNSTNSPGPSSRLSILNTGWVMELVPSTQRDSQATAADRVGILGSKLSFLPSGFLNLSGRTLIWGVGWDFIKQSPILGFGFHADRLVMGTHMHNTIMHSMIQTGVVGTIPFAGALLLGWLLVLKAIRRLNQLPESHKHLVIQTAGILLFLSIRGIMESTGAFFGVDWLLLAPLLLYIQVITARHHPAEAEVGA